MKLFKKNIKHNQDVSRTPNAISSKYTYYSKRKDFENKSGKDPAEKLGSKFANKKASLSKNFLIVILLFVFIFVILYYGTIKNLTNIKIDNKNNVATRETEIYKKFVTEYIGSSILNQTKLLFDSRGLSKELKQRFPEISAVDINLPLIGRTPEVKISITKPGFILSSNKQFYVIGINGVALLKLSDVKDQNNLNLHIVNDQAYTKIEPGKAALPKEQALFISTVVEQLESQGYSVDTLTIPSSIYDLHVKLKDENFYIKFNILEDAKQQVGSFIALHNYMKSKGQTANEYIDVRVGERVFYR